MKQKTCTCGNKDAFVLWIDGNGQEYCVECAVKRLEELEAARETNEVLRKVV